MEINNSGFYGTFVFVPVVDGVFITERPSLLLREGKVNINRVRLVFQVFTLPEKIILNQIVDAGWFVDGYQRIRRRHFR